MDKDMRAEITAIWEKLNSLSKQLSDFSEMLNEQRKKETSENQDAIFDLAGMVDENSDAILELAESLEGGE